MQLRKGSHSSVFVSRSESLEQRPQPAGPSDEMCINLRCASYHALCKSHYCMSTCFGYTCCSHLAASERTQLHRALGSNEKTFDFNRCCHHDVSYTCPSLVIIAVEMQSESSAKEGAKARYTIIPKRLPDSDHDI